ncbi:MAG: hypothetical protein ABIH24_04945 [Verrucomicrobiota bacterium]
MVFYGRIGLLARFEMLADAFQRVGGRVALSGGCRAGKQRLNQAEFIFKNLFFRAG